MCHFSYVNVLLVTLQPVMNCMVTELVTSANTNSLNHSLNLSLKNISSVGLFSLWINHLKFGIPLFQSTGNSNNWLHLGERFGINCPSAFLKISKMPEWNESNFKTFSRVIYPKTDPNQTCGYWLITPNQQTKYWNKVLKVYKVLELISFNNGQLQISVRAITKTPLTVRC